jgi:endonuclease VIII
VPEGDTITRAARNLDAALAGRRLVRFEAPRLVGRPPRPGLTVRSVEARGKHLLVHFSDGRALHTHLRMNGSWHLYRLGEPWRRPHSRARVVLEVDDGTIAVCFSAPTVELVDPGRTDQRRALDTLGPDLCRADADLDEADRRLARLDPDTEIGVALLNQRVAAGIGNVYKSEVCFACRVDPGRRLADLDDATRQSLLRTAATLLRANLDTARRTTVPGGLAVYGRAGAACRRCGTTIRRRRQGDQARSSYWCPTCQPSGG